MHYLTHNIYIYVIIVNEEDYLTITVMYSQHMQPRFVSASIDRRLV